MPAKDVPPPYAFPLPLLACVAAFVATVGGARYWETATGLGYWTWVACALIPLAAGLLIYRRTKQRVVFLGSRADPESGRPGWGGLLTSVVLFLVPRLAGDGAAALALSNGAAAGAAAVAATVVPFAVVVLGYRAAETALNRRDAASTAGPSRA
jgi:hypothetical protein